MSLILDLDWTSITQKTIFKFFTCTLRLARTCRVHWHLSVDHCLPSLLAPSPGASGTFPSLPVKSQKSQNIAPGAERVLLH